MNNFVILLLISNVILLYLQLKNKRFEIALVNSVAILFLVFTLLGYKL
jgi:hypothetical protein